MKRCPYCDEEIRDNAVKCKHCGSTLTDGSPTPGPTDTLSGAKTLHPDQVVAHRVLAGRYEIVERLGSGGMGEVYKAVDREMDNMSVAIKVLPPELARNKRSVKALRREAAISLKLTHPNICRLYNFHADGEFKFLVMEHIDGLTLEDLLDKQDDRKLSVDELLPIARQVAEALDHSHAQQPPILHRDIKPSNIMVASDGTAKVLDFGIARQMKESMTMVTGQETSGTLLYMSPEQYSGKRVTPASDIYSFAATMYECLAGHPPFYRGAIGDQIKNDPPEAIAGLPEHVNAALMAGLAKEAEDRPGNVTDFVSMAAGPVPAEPASAAVPTPQASVEDHTGARPEPGSVFTNSIGMKLVYIPPGEFMMGSPEDEEGRSDDERQHIVKLTKGFYMGHTQVTQAQWKAAMGDNPSHFRHTKVIKEGFLGIGRETVDEDLADHPVECVSWDDAVQFCEKLSRNVDGRYRLPTEAQWEYACRAGTTGPYAGSGKLDEMGWYADNSGGKTHPAEAKKPNAWGSYDMHGNVWEWCNDWHGAYQAGPATDPPGPRTGERRVLRGGSWNYDPGRCRSAYRHVNTPGYLDGGYGFRVCLHLE